MQSQSPAREARQVVRAPLPRMKANGLTREGTQPATSEISPNKLLPPTCNLSFIEHLRGPKLSSQTGRYLCYCYIWLQKCPLRSTYEPCDSTDLSKYSDLLRRCKQYRSKSSSAPQRNPICRLRGAFLSGVETLLSARSFFDTSYFWSLLNLAFLIFWR